MSEDQAVDADDVEGASAASGRRQGGDSGPIGGREGLRSHAESSDRSAGDDDQAPKSAYEIAMARLRSKDRAAGIEERPLSETQRAEIAELRKLYEARLAEREILHRSALARAGDPEACEKLEEEYRRDRERLNGERERKIEEVRRRG